jgi:ABC-type multidrug transport system ATPase subunit/pSer/pThr/pTyr-binding forkhead associated (FHA) protein
MTIILAEKLTSGALAQERAFEKDLLRVGRDPADCDIFFDSSAHPMVSRKHAELRGAAGSWTLADNSSTYGTFVNGKRIAGQAPLGVGDLIQFGENGPTLKVVWFETTGARPTASAPSAPPGAIKNPFEAAQPPRNAVSAPPPVRVPTDQQFSRPTTKARLEFKDAKNAATFDLNGNEVWLGRDSSCSVSFQESDVMVSRRHAKIRYIDGEYIVEDNNSFNGTLVNEQRIAAPTPLYDNDEIRLGIGGPVLRFVGSGRTAPSGSSLPGQRSIAVSQLSAAQLSEQAISSRTMVLQAGAGVSAHRGRNSSEPQLLMSLAFGDKSELTIGRDDRNDIKLDGLQISNRHARLVRNAAGVVIEDLNSTNGVYVNGNRVSRQAISATDRVQIGSFLILADAAANIGVFDTRSKTRLDAVRLTKYVRGRFGAKKLKVLDDISLSIRPNEFVGLLGPSGAGKSMLMDAMNGRRPANSGNVLVNNLDLYRHLDQLKQSIGYVPQDDVIHRELTVYRTLYYVAKLRLSGDISAREIDQTVNEVLDITGLSERRNVRVDSLSGGQRKRVSIAVELITKPSVIFLDEPTSGLDPGTEERIMKLFRQIAESGRTVVMTTHAMENVRLFDKIAVLVRGKLVFYGKPDEALAHLKASSFKDLFDKLQEPADTRKPSDRDGSSEEFADKWKQRYLDTPEFRKYVESPLKELGTLESTGVRKKRRLGIFGSIRQLATLSRRYLEILLKDKLTLLVLMLQGPVIALLTYLVMSHDRPRDFVYFVLALVSMWFGTSVAAREIVRERPVYSRERMVNLGILPYLFSKLFILGLIVAIQCVLLFLPLKFLDLTGWMSMPGETLGIPQFWAMLLTAAVGIGMGLFVSALVKSSELASSLVPLILIPQILFSGLVGVPHGVEKVVALSMPAAWSFDTIKRFSTLDTLEPEGAEPAGATGGKGLYQFVQTQNEKIVTDARKSIEDYRRSAETKFKEYDNDVRSGKNPPAPLPDEPPAIQNPHDIPKDLSGYITYLNPWMNEILNQIVLMLMFGMLAIATLIALKLQDIR